MNDIPGSGVSTMEMSENRAVLLVLNVHFCLLEIFSVFFLLAFGQGYDNFLPSAITFD